MQEQKKKLLIKIRALLLFFIVALALSGITAMPAETEMAWLVQFTHLMPAGLANFVTRAYEGLRETNQRYPMLAYGYDWLGFGHLVIAMAFIGPLRNPVKNIWVIEWAMLACIAVLPLAFIAGPIRGIPFIWQLVDCSFGVFGIIPLYLVRRWIKQLEVL